MEADLDCSAPTANTLRARAVCTEHRQPCHRRRFGSGLVELQQREVVFDGDGGRTDQGQSLRRGNLGSAGEVDGADE